MLRVILRNLINNKVFPTDFDDNEFNVSKFKVKDKPFEEDWFIYHKNNAKFRCLCSKCNSTRKLIHLLKMNKNPFKLNKNV